MSTYMVSNGKDSGAGSLRAAVKQAKPGDTVLFVSGVTTVTLTSEEIYIDKNLTIVGCYTGEVVIIRDISAPNFGIFHIDKSAHVTIHNVKICGGSAPSGAGINITNGCQLQLNKCSIVNNYSRLSGAGISGINCEIFMTYCTISDNTSSNTGGGISLTSSSLSMSYTTISGNKTINDGLGAGILLSYSKFSIINSTICTNGNTPNSTPDDRLYISSGVKGTIYGGGIYLASSNGCINNTTIANNLAIKAGAGIYQCGISNNNIIKLINNTIAENHTDEDNGAGITCHEGILRIGNTIVAKNKGAQKSNDVRGTFESLGYNLIGNKYGSSGFGKDDMCGSLSIPLDPMLESLADNGSSTMTMALLDGSPAINAGNVNLNAPTLHYNTAKLDYSFKNKIDIGVLGVPHSGCHSAKSKILVRNINTNIVSELNAEEVVSSIHEVYDMENEIFVPIIFNIITGKVSQLVVIKANSLSENEPFEDLYVPGGHYLVVNGERIKARDIPQSEKLKVSPQNIFYICTTRKCPILINGVQVFTWSYDNWMSYSQKGNINWKNNIVKSKF